MIAIANYIKLHIQKQIKSNLDEQNLMTTKSLDNVTPSDDVTGFGVVNKLKVTLITERFYLYQKSLQAFLFVIRIFLQK